MANVDPFVVQWPKAWIEDPEIGPVVEYMNRFLHDLWLRTGGGTDAVGDLENGELYEPGVQTFDSDDMDSELNDIERIMSIDSDDIDSDLAAIEFNRPMTIDTDQLNTELCEARRYALMVG